MSETYYGPWFKTFPQNAPDGSIWELRPELDEESVLSSPCVYLHERLFDGNDLRDPHDYPSYSFRRVYPPGSVLPEPRPLVVDGKVRDLSKSEWWMLGDWNPKRNVYDWGNVCREILCDKWHQEMINCKMIEPTIYYPVQRLDNGTFIPIPWPDSGCTTE